MTAAAGEDGQGGRVAAHDAGQQVVPGRGLEAVIAGAPPGDPRAKPLTYAQAFQFVFGESLDRAEAA